MTPMGNLRTDNESDTVSLEGALKFTELNLQKLHGEALLIKKVSHKTLWAFLYIGWALVLCAAILSFLETHSTFWLFHPLAGFTCLAFVSWLITQWVDPREESLWKAHACARAMLDRYQETEAALCDTLARIEQAESAISKKESAPHA